MIGNENKATRGRNLLHQWQESKPHNFFAADHNLEYVLRRHLEDFGFDSVKVGLDAFGAKVAAVIDPCNVVEDRIGNHPRLERYNGVGERVEQIEFHPNHDIVGRLIWPTRIMAMQREPGNTVHQMALFYLLNHTADGHSCGLACTSGLIRALQQAASDEVKRKFLPPLLEPEYDYMEHGAQFLTEVQGGSDVGANAVIATDTGDGTWRLNGEKWFCSNINADQFLVMARPEGAKEGTRGLAAFLVPRKLDDGSTNEFYIRRLKDKLGTRLLASAELDFRGAVAYPIGPTDGGGFKMTVELVLNTSRLMNSVACTGFMRRAYIEAASYACTREAFGSVIAQYPMVREAIADIMSETYAATASSFAVAALLDKIETGVASDGDRAAFRMFVNINKYITSIRATEAVHRAIEVLGGNGAIESFSVLPRMYRDAIVLESWEGTHNVLCLQVMRDIKRYAVHEPFCEYLNTQLAAVKDEDLREQAVKVIHHLDETNQMIDRVIPDDMQIQAHARRLVDRYAHAAQAAIMLSEAQYERNRDFHTHKPDVIAYFINRRLHDEYDPLYDDEYLPRLERLMAAY